MHGSILYYYVLYVTDVVRENEIKIMKILPKFVS